MATAIDEGHRSVGNGISKPLSTNLLELFAREAGAGPQRGIIQLINKAGWHPEAGPRMQECLRLVKIPLHL